MKRIEHFDCDLFINIIVSSNVVLCICVIYDPSTGEERFQEVKEYKFWNGYAKISTRMLLYCPLFCLTFEKKLFARVKIISSSWLISAAVLTVPRLQIA